MFNAMEFSQLIRSFGSFSPKKLQKLCYYVYSIYLKEYNEKIAYVYFEAWVHGPVSPEIYNIYKIYGWNNIPQYNGFIDINDTVYKRVEQIVQKYIVYDAQYLEEMTHSEAPWQIARKGYSKYEPSNVLINDDDILEYY